MASPPDAEENEALQRRISDLLERGRTQTTTDARQALLRQATAHLVPDECLILDELARRRVTCLLHVHSWTRTGVAGEVVLQNASSIGRWAGVALPQLTAFYLGRLRFVQLVEVGPEDESLHDEYQALLVDPAVLSALGRASAGHVTPRVLRHTLSLSTLGRELWATAFPATIPHPGARGRS